MPNIRPRAIFIGVQEVGDALADMRDDWDFLPHVPDIGTFWEGLTSGAIDSNIQIILILDQFFDTTGEDNSFEKVIASYSPYCFFGIINYTDGIKDAVRERVEYEAYQLGSSGDPMYFYIDPSDPQVTIDQSIDTYAHKGGDPSVVAVLTGQNPPAEIPEEDYNVGPATSSLGEVEEENEYLGQIVSVTSSKGGSGKSTVATVLASYLAHASESSAMKGYEERPLKILILDLDIRDGQIGFLTGNSKPTVISLRVNDITEQTLDDTIIHSSRLKVDLLLAPKRPKNSDDTPPEFYIELLQHLRRRYDYVFLDTSVNYLDPLLEKVAYPTSEQIVFVTDIVVNSIFSMTRWIQEVTKPKVKGGMGINASKIGIVVNKAMTEVNMSSEKIERSALGLPIISVIPSNPKLVAHSANLQSMELLLRHPDFRSSIRKLAKGIVGKKYKLDNEF